ncbi:MAG: hypothetical protein IPI65_16765 [Bacteroidetes bacterium]|nr:hypothetical protein [Bacteroidota bacterium]
MKTIKLLITLLLFPVAINAQAHLGLTETEIKALYPYNTWVSDYATDGTKYISSDMLYGNFVYYFDSNGLSEYCLQIPSSMVNLNTQVQIYNQKYVITSTSSWTAYLEGGNIMYIRLKYDSQYELYSFQYSATPFVN